MKKPTFATFFPKLIIKPQYIGKQRSVEIRQKIHEFLHHGLESTLRAAHFDNHAVELAAISCPTQDTNRHCKAQNISLEYYYVIWDIICVCWFFVTQARSCLNCHRLPPKKQKFNLQKDDTIYENRHAKNMTNNKFQNCGLKNSQKSKLAKRKKAINYEWFIFSHRSARRF